MEQRTAHQTSTRHATAQQAAPKPHVILQPPSGWQAVHLPELWQARDLLLSLAARDVKLRYRQTALGILWVVLQPLIAAGIFTFVFGKVAKLPAPEGVPYLVFSFAGLLAWNAFSSTLTKSSSCLVGNAPLVSKVYFPRLILPLSTVVSILLDFAVSLVVMALLMMIFHVPAAPEPSSSPYLARADHPAGSWRRPVRGGPDGLLPGRPVRAARGDPIPALRQPRRLRPVRRPSTLARLVRAQPADRTVGRLPLVPAGRRAPARRRHSCMRRASPSPSFSPARPPSRRWKGGSPMSSSLLALTGPDLSAGVFSESLGRDVAVSSARPVQILLD